MQKIKKFAVDFILGAIGLLAMNGVTALLVYPYLERQLGAAGQGRILFFTAIAGLMGATFGSGAAYGRLKVYTREKYTENGEYNIFLLITAAVLALVTVLAIVLKGDTAGATGIGIFAVLYTTTVRHYGDVEYRMSLNYKRFSLYYVIIAAGYLPGLLLYRLTGSWVLIFLCGECAGILFLIITGSIFKRPLFKTTPAFTNNLKTVYTLSGSFFLSDFVSAADRLLFPILLVNGDELTSLYYYASLVGKMMSLISSPLNGVLSGYMAREEGGLKRKSFLKIVLLMLAVWIVVTLGACLGSYIFVYLFYRDYLDTVKPLFLLANAGQVIFFICNTMMVVVLRYTHERNQIIVSVSYIIAFFAVTVPLILKFGVWGMAWGIFTVNTLKFILFAILGFIGLNKKPAETVKAA